MKKLSVSLSHAARHSQLGALKLLLHCTGSDPAQAGLASGERVGRTFFGYRLRAGASTRFLEASGARPQTGPRLCGLDMPSRRVDFCVVLA